MTQVQQFVAMEYIAACEKPGRYRVYTPYVESNSPINGWQDSGMNGMDTHYTGQWWMYFDSFEWRYVPTDEFEDDYKNGYYACVLTSTGKMVWAGKPGAETPTQTGNGQYGQPESSYPAGTWVYKNLGNTWVEDISSEQNFS